MKNFKIAKKLIISLLTIAALGVIIAVIGILSMISMNKADDDLYNMNLIAVSVVGQIDSNIISQRVYLRNVVIYEAETDTFNSALTTLDTLDADLKKLSAQYEKLITTDEDRNNYNEFVNTYNGAFTKSKNDIIAAGKANDFDAARTALNNAAVAASTINTAVNKCIELNEAEAETAVGANTKLFISSTIIEIAVLLISIVVSIALAIYISKLIANPITKMKNIIDVVKNTGRMSFTEQEKQDLISAASEDEVGQSIKAFSAMLDRFIFISKNLELIAAGDLRVSIQSISADDTIGNAVNNMADNLNSMFTQINQASEQVNSGSDQVSSGAQALSQGATEQASSIEELSASIIDISDQVNDNSQNASKAAEIAQETSKEVSVGNKQMREMLTAMGDINTSSNEISKIIKVIDDIAFQTNILALNAAVEAARAGAAGKGFAVVADEVRNLASKSADAAKQTTALIEGSVQSVNNGVQIANRTAESLEIVAKKTDEVGSLVANIATASHDQAVAISQINVGVSQISSVVQNNSATAEESAAAAEELSGQANMLGELISQFKLK